MNKIILLFGVATLFNSCGKDGKDCDCSQQRWERKAIYTVVTPPAQSVFISATEWQTAGNKESINSDDCSQNGTNGNSGNSGSTLSSDGTKFTTTEYEYRITCQ